MITTGKYEQREEQDISQKYIKVVQDKELNIRLAEEIRSPRNMLYAAYQQAHNAVREIVMQTIIYNKENEVSWDEYYKNDLLARYNGNIVAFEAQRGYGKTQTMLSFSYLLSQTDRKDNIDARFIVLPMIAPSALEEKQNLLYVVLSRLYCYAEKLVNKKCRDISEHDRVKLSEYLQKCLNGINGIKRMSDNDSYDDFSKLQDISDGLALRKHFYKLIQFLACLEDGNNVFFVIQLDDVDSQIQNGYKVLDDIRKYLLIPNLIILISTDGDLLYRSILEEHLQQFKALKDIDSENIPSLLSKISKKYIDKLIPPSHMVHLPRIDQFIGSSGTDLQLYYCKEDRHEFDIIFKNDSEKHTYDLDSSLVYGWEKDLNYGLQDFLFMLIYRKTRIVFAKHANYLHNIVPQSLRGLNQLLFLLRDMKDIPVFDESDFQNERDYLNAWTNRIAVNEINLSVFMNYFINEWVDVKLTKTNKKGRNDREFLRDLIKAPKDDKIVLAVDYLCKYFIISFPNKPDYLLFQVNKLIDQLSKEYKKNEDYLLFFSIHVIFSIECKRLVLSKQTVMVRERLITREKENYEGPRQFLSFDLEPQAVFIPTTYLIQTLEPISENTREKLKKQGVTYDIGGIISRSFQCVHRWMSEVEKNDMIMKLEEGKQITTKDFYRDIGNSLIAKTASGQYQLSFINIISVILRLGATCLTTAIEKQADEKTKSLNSDLQKTIYWMQEIALFIAENWDVQEKIYKYFQEAVEKTVPNQSFFLSLDQYTDLANNPYMPKKLHTFTYNIIKMLCECIDYLLKDHFKHYMTYNFLGLSPTDGNNSDQKITDHGLAQAYMNCRAKHGVFFSNIDFGNEIITPLFGIDIPEEMAPPHESDQKPPVKPPIDPLDRTESKPPVAP